MPPARKRRTDRGSHRYGRRGTTRSRRPGHPRRSRSATPPEPGRRTARGSHRCGRRGTTRSRRPGHPRRSRSATPPEPERRTARGSHRCGRRGTARSRMRPFPATTSSRRSRRRPLLPRLPARLPIPPAFPRVMRDRLHRSPATISGPCAEAAASAASSEWLCRRLPSPGPWQPAGPSSGRPSLLVPRWFGTCPRCRRR